MNQPTHNPATGTHTLAGRTIHYGDTLEVSLPGRRWVPVRAETWSDGLCFTARQGGVWARVTVRAGALFRWPDFRREGRARSCQC